MNLEDLMRKREELVTRAGRLRPEGLTEFVQLVEKANSLRDTNLGETERLHKRANDMLPQVEQALEQAISIRDRIKAKMIEHAGRAVETYRDVLNELAK